MVVGRLIELAEKGIDLEHEDSYYNDEEEQEGVDPTIAARSLGPVGYVRLQNTLWSRYVPSNLQEKYREWKERSGGVGPFDGVGVSEMLDTLVRDGALSKRDGMDVAKVRPKSSEKCPFILNCVKQNDSDARKPHGFHLPQTEQLWKALMLEGRRKLYLAKLDLSNCFWSIWLPKKWVGALSVCVGDTQYI